MYGVSLDTKTIKRVPLSPLGSLRYPLRRRAVTYVTNVIVTPVGVFGVADKHSMSIGRIGNRLVLLLHGYCIGNSTTYTHMSFPAEGMIAVWSNVDPEDLINLMIYCSDGFDDTVLFVQDDKECKYLLLSFMVRSCFCARSYDRIDIVAKIDDQYYAYCTSTRLCARFNDEALSALKARMSIRVSPRIYINSDVPSCVLVAGVEKLIAGTSLPEYEVEWGPIKFHFKSASDNLLKYFDKYHLSEAEQDAEVIRLFNMFHVNTLEALDEVIPALL